MTPARRVAGLSSLGMLILIAAGGVLVAKGVAAYGWWLVALGLANLAVPAAALTKERRQVKAEPAEDTCALTYGQGQVTGVFGIETLDVTVGQDVEVAPARRSKRHQLGGIEIRLPGRPAFYFWSDGYAEVLAVVAAAGLEVSDEEQTMKLRW